MNLSNVVAASQLAHKYGVKMICYGPPGSGKTPAVKTAPRPIMLVCEPGMMTMRDSNVPCYQASTGAQIREFFIWLTESAEARQFDTACIDSGSEMAEIILKEKFARNKDGRKAYGEMSTEAMEHFDKLYYMPQKHVYIICKQKLVEEVQTSYQNGVPVIQNINKASYYFPGQDLPMKVSHRYDLILQANKGAIPGVTGRHAYFRCIESDTIMARDRSGMLAEYEPLDIGGIIKKCGY